MTEAQNVKVNVEGGRYTGHKWFLKIAYKIIETDVAFFDDKISLSQGTAFAIVKEKFTTDIEYKNIRLVTTKKKYSTPNILLAVFAVLGAMMTGVWAALLVAAFVVWLGSTAVTVIEHTGGIYEVTTEFKSEADELQSKINMAISQSK